MAKPESLKESDYSAVRRLQIERLSNALVLIADGIDEITDMGDHDLDGKAALGFASIVRTCGEDLRNFSEKKGECQ